MLWVCTFHSQHEIVDLQRWVAQEPRACTLSRGSAEVQILHTQRGISPLAFHWIHLCRRLLWCQMWAQAGMLPSIICSGNRQWPHTGLAGVISLGFMSSLSQGVKTALSILTVHLCGLGENSGLKQWSSCNMEYQEACKERYGGKGERVQLLWL